MITALIASGLVIWIISLVAGEWQLKIMVEKFKRESELTLKEMEKKHGLQVPREKRRKLDDSMS